MRPPTKTGGTKHSNVGAETATINPSRRTAARRLTEFAAFFLRFVSGILSSRFPASASAAVQLRISRFSSPSKSFNNIGLISAPPWTNAHTYRAGHPACKPTPGSPIQDGLGKRRLTACLPPSMPAQKALPSGKYILSMLPSVIVSSGFSLPVSALLLHGYHPYRIQFLLSSEIGNQWAAMARPALEPRIAFP